MPGVDSAPDSCAIRRNCLINSPQAAHKKTLNNQSYELRKMRRKPRSPSFPTGSCAFGAFDSFWRRARLARGSSFPVAWGLRRTRRDGNASMAA